MNSLWDFVDYEIFVGSLFELKIFSSNFLERNSLRLIIFFFFFLEGTWFGNEGIHHKFDDFLEGEFLKGISIDFQSDFLRFNSNLFFDKLA